MLNPLIVIINSQGPTAPLVIKESKGHKGHLSSLINAGL
jgi:hypothetical protein